MDAKPKRISKQRLNQTICVYCTFNNIVQQEVFHSPCQFLGAFETISRSKGLKIPPDYWGKSGISSDTLKVLFQSYGFCVKKKRSRIDVKIGWGEFEVIYNGMKFLHAVAIRDGYIVDSIEIPTNQGGIYPWAGTLYGYDSTKMMNLYSIEK